MLESLLIRLFRWRKITLATAGITWLALIAFWPRLTLDDSAERWMPRSSVAAWQRFSRHFEAGDSVAVGMAFQRPVHDKDIEHLRTLRQSLERIPGIRRVYDLSLVAEQIERVPLTMMLDPHHMKRFDLYRGALFDAADKGHSGIRTLMTFAELEAFPPAERSQRRRQVVRDLYEAVHRHQEQYADVLRDVDFHVAGGIVIQAQLERLAVEMAVGGAGIPPRPSERPTSSPGIFAPARELLERTLRQPPFLPLSLLITLGIFGFGFRSWRALVVAVLGATWTTGVVLGTIAAAGISLNVVTVAGPTLMTVIGTATAIHFAHYHSQHVLPRPGQLVRWVAVPCFGAALATGAGFLMLAFNELRPIRELGFELFAGSLLAFLGVFVATLSIPMGATAPGRVLANRRLELAARYSIRRPAFTVAVMVGVTATAAVAATGIYVDADPFSFFRPESPLARALRHFSQQRFGLYPLEVVLIPRSQTTAELPLWPTNLHVPVDHADRLQYDADHKHLVYCGVMSDETSRELLGLSTDPDYCRALREIHDQSQRWKNDPKLQARAVQFVQQIERRPEVLKVISTVSFQQRLQEFFSSLRQLALSDPQEAAGEIRRTMEQIRVFRESFVGWSTDRQDEGAMRITLLTHDPGTGFGPLVEAVESTLPHDGFDAFSTGSVAEVVVLSRNLVGGMAAGLTMSLIVMAALCCLLLGSIRLTAIAALPNLFPLVVVFGLMGLTCQWAPPGWAIPVNSGSAMVATIALGIALNDTLHFLLHYRRQTREEGLPVPQAITRTYQHLGRPIILTSVVHAAGFSIFLLSDFQPLNHFGILAVLAMAAALVGDLVLLPNLLLVFDRRRPRAKD